MPANEGWGTTYGSIQSPGNDPYVITVGATKSMDGIRAHDRIATYSSRGPSRLDLVLKPDILAPGNKIVSTNTNNSYLAKNFGATNEIPYSSYTTQNAGHLSQDYFCLSGTSMAAPVVAGAAALMLQASPNLTPDTVKARLMLSADKWADPSGNADALTYGAGYLNIPAALLSSATASLPALSPTLVANSDGSLSLVMDRAAWGSTALAGSRPPGAAACGGPASPTCGRPGAARSTRTARPGAALPRTPTVRPGAATASRPAGPPGAAACGTTGRLGLQHGRCRPDLHGHLRRKVGAKSRGEK